MKNTSKKVLDKSFLKKVHTKVLLKILRKVCVNSEELDNRFMMEYDDDWEWAKRWEPKFTTNKDKYYEVNFVDAEYFGFEETIKSTITIADLKTELSTREHIPNKIEAKQIRKDKAKANRNKGRKNR